MRKSIFIAALIASGRAATGPKYVEPPKLDAGYARIYIYRANAMQGKAWSNVYRIGTVEVASLRAGGYTYFTVKPGQYQVTTGPEQHKLAVELDAIQDQEYFIRENPNSENLPREAIISSSENHVSAYSGGAIPSSNQTFSSRVSWTDKFSQIKGEYAKKDLIENNYRYQSPMVKSLN